MQSQAPTKMDSATADIPSTEDIAILLDAQKYVWIGWHVGSKIIIGDEYIEVR